MGETRKIRSISDLVPDNRNYNRGTEYGGHLLERSLRQNGLGRGVLADADGIVIAGNKTVEKAVELEFTKVVVVPTDGNTLVVTQRTDLHRGTREWAEMALADNATAQADLDFDTDLILEDTEVLGFDPGDWGIDVDSDGKREGDGGEGSGLTLIVSCDSGERLRELSGELMGRGFKVELKE